MVEEQISLFVDNPEYDAFVKKFEPKKTTDDCYTPPLVYEAVKDWCCKKYNIDPEKIVRPFYPGGDYENFQYPAGCCVLDNPPFSILTKICEFYLDRGISFFLFAPALTAFSGKNVCMKMNHIFCDCQITYENGAAINTAFVTNLDKDLIAETAPTLKEAINAVQASASTAKKNPRYDYPAHVVTAAMCGRYAKYGISFSVRKTDCAMISKLDEQTAHKKTIFGSGLLLSDRSADENAAAAAAAAAAAGDYAWTLSDREIAFVKTLGREEEFDDE